MCGRAEGGACIQFTCAMPPYPPPNRHVLPTSATMALRQRQLRAIRNDRNLARFVVEGTATGKQLGTGSYGSVEEVNFDPCSIGMAAFS